MIYLHERAFVVDAVRRVYEAPRQRPNQLSGATLT